MPANFRKLALVAAGLVLVALFFGLGLQRYLTLEYLKASRQGFQELYAARPLLTVGAYGAIYVLSTALQLPGALVLSLAGGAMFGFWTGLVVVSFASSIGATLACALARYLLRDWVQRRLGQRLEAVNAGLQRDGAFYLFSMRLIPAIPFFAINLLMGLTALPLTTFYWVSQLGMLPATVVIVNAGVQLGHLDSLRGILSPGLLASFALLGLLPLALKKLLPLLRPTPTR